MQVIYIIEIEKSEEVKNQDKNKLLNFIVAIFLGNFFNYFATVFHCYDLGWTIFMVFLRPMQYPVSFISTS